MPVDQKFYLLVSLKLSGEATPEELAQLDMLLENFPDLKVQAEVLTALWNAGQKGPEINKAEALARHLQRMSHFNIEMLPPDATGGAKIQVLPKRPAVNSARWIAAAACVFFCVGGIKYLPQLTHHAGSNRSHVITARPGSRMQLKLPDGTSVWLNAGSSIYYTGDFQGHLREVRLSGEAFFDVARDDNRPFVIHTNTIDLKVLGTSFNLRSYDNEKETEASLVSGAVEVTLRNDPGKKIVLKPKEKILINNNRCDSAVNNMTAPKQTEESPLIVLTKIRYWGRDSSNNLESAWVRNRLVFDKQPLADIAEKIERWYNVKVVIADSRLSESKYTGLFENEKLEEVLEALRLTGGFHYSIKENIVTINQ